MQSGNITKELFSQINPEVLQETLFYLGQDSSILDDSAFQRNVNLFYTTTKKDLYTSDFWNFTRVHNYTLMQVINPLTGKKENQLPPDFLMLIKGFDKQNARYGTRCTIYDTSFLNTWDIRFPINYIRYVYDNDTKVIIPPYFNQYIALKLAMKLLINNTYQTTQTNRQELEVELTSIRIDAKRQDSALNPFTSGIDYESCNLNNN